MDYPLMAGSSISIIVPTYNRAHLLIASVRSCLEQAEDDLEVVVGDDGSTDNTQAVVATFGDPRIRYMYQENRGLPAARNAGMRIATGEYIGFLDSDDLYLPAAMAALRRMLDERPDVGLVSGGWRYIDDSGAIVGHCEPWLHAPRLHLDAWLTGCPVLSCSVLIRRSWLEQAGGFDETFRRAEDYDLWLRLAYLGCQMVWIKEIVCSYRIHASQMTDDAVAQNIALVRVLDKFFNQPGVPGDLAMRREELVALRLAHDVPSEVFAGQTQEARANLAAAIRLWPPLLERRGEVLFQCLVGWAGHLRVHDRVAHLRAVLDALPAEAATVRTRRREALAIGAAGQIFARQFQDSRALRRLLAVIGINDPRWLTNRGLISIAVRCHLDRLGTLASPRRT